MAETNFYSYMYAQASAVAFDELAEVVELSSPESIQRAFESYMEEYAPPLDIKEALLEEKFYMSPGEGPDGSEKYIRYDMSVPGVLESVDAEGLKAYLEDFLEKIGAINDSRNSCIVDVDLTNNERGGTDIDIFIALGGKQIRSNKA